MHIIIFFWLDVSHRHVLHGIPQWFTTYIIKIITCSLGAISFIKFNIKCFFNHVCAKEQLLLKVWGYESDAEDNNVEVYISFLRRKLEHLHSQAKIRTIRMVGYCLEPNN